MTQSSVKGLVSICFLFDELSPEIFDTLKSLQNQRYTSFEILIIDASQSFSHSKDIFESFCSVDKRIKYFSSKIPLDLKQKINFLLNNSSGEYICFCTDDTWYAPEFLEFLVKKLIDDSFSKYAFCNFYKNGNDKYSINNTTVSRSEEFGDFRHISSFLRTTFFYWRNQDLATTHLFYSLFQKSEFQKIYLKYTAEKYERIGFMQFVVFNFLKSSYLSFTEEPLINIKSNYLENLEFKSLKKLLPKNYSTKKNFLILPLGILNYLSFHDGIVNKLHILSIFFIKLSYQLFEFPLIKVLAWIKSMFSKFGLHYNNSINNYAFEDCLDKLKLLNVTLVAVSTRDTEEALKALIYSSKNIEYGKIILISSYTPFCIDNKVHFFTIPKFNNVDEWCKFIVYELHRYVHTEFALLVHADGFVVNKSSWREEFLDYDYIGAPWDIPNNDFTFRDINGRLIRVGNSVSIRSKKLLKLPYELNIPWLPDHGSFNEDTFLCCTNRHILESNGIRYAPIEVAKYFAHESMIPEIKSIVPFAFHKWGGSNKIYPNFFPKKRNDYFSVKFYIFIFRSILDIFKQKPGLR